MNRVLISILSDYLQPNFLLIKEFEGRYDKLVFVTTGPMEDKKKKSYWLEKALALPENSVQRIIVVEDDFEMIKSEFAKAGFSTEDEYLLNLTGGTKVMPLAAYEFFKNGFKASYYYVPIGKNVIKSLRSDTELVLNYRMNLKEYFTLYGLRYECDNSLFHPENFTNDLFDRFRKVKFNRSRIHEIKESQTLPDAKDRKYYGGSWFEEYCYNRLKREQNLPDDAICKDATIYRENSTSNDNEIDVMFIQDNQLFVFECKVGMTGYGYGAAKETIEQYQYKLAAIAKDLGLRVEAYILTLHKIFNNLKYFSAASIENIRKRQDILGLREIIDSIVFTRNEPLLEGCKRKMPTPIAPKKQQISLKIIGKMDLDTLNKK